MVSQDLVYSVLPRQTGQVEQQKRMVEKVVKRSSLKPVDEEESPQLDIVVGAKKERRRNDRRKTDRRVATSADTELTCRESPTAQSASDNGEKPRGLDIFV